MNKRRTRSTLLAVLAVVALCDAKPAMPIIGKNFLGLGMPCAVACGKDGLVNTQFAGDMVAKYISGPSIDNAGDRMDRSIDRGLSKFQGILDEKISRIDELATTQRTAFIEELTTAADDANAQLSVELDAQISAADQILDNALRRGDVLSKVLAWDIARQIAFVLIGVVFLSVSAALIYRRHVVSAVARANKRQIKVVFMVGALCAVGAIVAQLGFVLQAKNLRDTLLAAYDESTQKLMYFHSASLSAQLLQLDPTDKIAQIRNKKANLLRDVFTQPGRYKSEKGIISVANRVNDLRRELQAAGIEADIDIEILAAMITWQSGTEHFSDYSAASIIANLLGEIGSRGIAPVSPASSLEPLALHYLRTYLRAPIDEQLLQVYGVDVAALDGAIDNRFQKYVSTETMQAVAAKYASVEVTPSSLLYSQIEFGRASSRVTLALNSALAQGLVLLATSRQRLIGGPMPKRQFFVNLSSDEVNQLRSVIEFAETEWATYLKALSEGRYQAQGLIPSAMRVPHHYLTYMRLWKPLLNGANVPAIPELSSAAVKALNACVEKALKEGRNQDTPFCFQEQFRAIASTENGAYVELMNGPLGKEPISLGAKKFLKRSAAEDWITVFRTLQDAEFQLTFTLNNQRASAGIPRKDGKPSIFVPMNDAMSAVIGLAQLGVIACGSSLEQSLICSGENARGESLFHMLHKVIPNAQNWRKLVPYEASFVLAVRPMRATI